MQQHKPNQRSRGRNPTRRIPDNARGLALRAVLAGHAGPRFASEALDKRLAQLPLDHREAALARELTAGVSRRRITLDALINHQLKFHPSTLDAAVRDVLRLAVYQIFWLDRVPEHAAVDEAVAQAKHVGGRRAGGLVNGVLRNLLRHIETANHREGNPPAMRSFLIDRDTYGVMDADLFADPAKKPARHLGQTTSHPTPLVERWFARHGIDATQIICRYGASRPHAWLRVNRLKTESRALAERLADEGVPTSIRTECALLVDGGPPSVQTAAFADGWFQPQDVTSLAVVEQLDPQAGEVVVDLCAGAGTKTAAIAEATQNGARILATDRDTVRLEAAARNFERLGVTCVEIVPLAEIAARVASLDRLNAILLDAPCSNTGVLARRPEARDRVNDKTLAALTRLQDELLATADRLSRDDTRIVYATCSLEHDENHARVDAFCAAHDRWQVDAARLALPTVARDDAPPRDGGFSARLRRRA